MSESATHDAMEAVARDTYGRLVAYIAARTGDLADAQDALSETLVAGHTRIPGWPPGRALFFGCSVARVAGHFSSTCSSRFRP